MLFESKFSAFQVLVRPESESYQSGVLVGVTRRLTANFGQHDGMANVETEDGRVIQMPMIRGYSFDSEVAADREGWTEEERELVEKALVLQCQKTPTFVWVKTAPVPVAPWKTYDSLTNYLKIATLAEELDLVREALDYERLTKGREGVVKALEEKLADKADVAEMTAA